MPEQLSLFAVIPPPPPAAVPIGDRTSVCACGARSRVYGRAWRGTEVVDLCERCTRAEVVTRRDKGLDVPPGYEWAGA